jgi:hypothetical protein
LRSSVVSWQHPSRPWQATRLPYNQTKYEIDLLPVRAVAASVCEACRCGFDRVLVTSPKYRRV